MFVTDSDFTTPPYNIPQIGLLTTTFPAYVNAQEIELLDKILGKTLRSQFYAGLAVLPTPDPKWIKLRDGATYVLNDVMYTYSGLKNFLIPYINATWIRDGFDSNSVIGVSVNNAENSEVISPSTRVVRGYNKASSIIGDECNQVDNIYGFLKANKETDYPDWRFESIGTMNLWNI